MASDVEHLFLYLWAICMSSLEKCLFRSYFHFFLRFYLFIFIERGREEGERNINVWLSVTCPPLETWPANQACALDWELNLQPFGSQAGIQSTEPHEPGIFFSKMKIEYFFHTVKRLHADCE